MVHISTPETKKLAEALEKKGWKIDREKLVSRMHIDISVPEAQVDIEVDGRQHNSDSNQALADLKRTAFVLNRDWITLRVPNSVIKDEQTFNEAVDQVVKILSERRELLKKKV